MNDHECLKARVLQYTCQKKKKNGGRVLDPEIGPSGLQRLESDDGIFFSSKAPSRPEASEETSKNVKKDQGRYPEF